MHVETILQTKGAVVHTVPDAATLAEAVAVLNHHDIGALVVTDGGGTVVGILSERDIVRRLGADPGGALEAGVAECMTRTVHTCTRTTTIAEVMEAMTRRRIRHMPVIEAEELLGIVSIGDVVKLKIEETEQEAAALRDYIAS